ncbi:hypothetical protein KDL44_10725 [bacterium]|nr:hypothetical protein [bacterium]
MQDALQGSPVLLNFRISGAVISLTGLSAVLRALHSLLRETEFGLRGTSRSDWQILAVQGGEAAGAPVALELRLGSAAENAEVAAALLGLIKGLEHGEFPEAGRWKAILSQVLVLARSVENGEISTMSLSGPDGSAVCITAGTFEHAGRLLRDLPV